jgi:predicted acetyltransferase
MSRPTIAATTTRTAATVITRTASNAAFRLSATRARTARIVASVPELVPPTTSLHTAFLECRDDWGPGLHEDGIGIGPEDELDSPAGFAAWVGRRLRMTHPAGAPCPAERHSSPRWIVEDGQVLGGIVLRHVFDEHAGHIGYGIRPSARGRGLATWALGRMLIEAQSLSLDRVLLVCAADNVPSIKTIEHHGGVPEPATTGDDEGMRRYWIEIP